MESAVAARPSLTDLVSLTKPGITRMITITTAVALFVAPGHVPVLTWILTLVGTALVVGAANSLNCYLERDVDRLMSRTRDRPLPAGRVEPETALRLGLGLAVVSIPLLTFAVNPLTGLLAAAALVSYVLVYTPLKRRSPLSTLVGAVPGALPALMGWAAATGRIDPPAVVLFAIVFFWQMPHFLAIGTFRKDEYARAGFKILPIVHGDTLARVQMLRYAAALLPVSLLLAPLGAAGSVYFVGALVLGVAFLAMVAWGNFARVVAESWGRAVFHASLLYLTGIFVLLVVDHLV